MKTVPRYAIESINYNQLINESRLSPHYEKIAPADSFHAANRGEAAAVDISASKSCIQRFVITEKAPATAFTFKTLLRDYAKRVLNPR